MADKAQQAKAETLRALHGSGVLVLANAWDAGSAAVIAAAGAKAVATTSGGIAWSLGRTDGHGLAREEMVEQVRRIAGAVDLPVTADIEGGYGPTPQDVAATVEAVVGAGAVGVNLEDSRAPGGPLFTAEEQAERLRAARAAAERRDCRAWSSMCAPTSSCSASASRRGGWTMSWPAPPCTSRRARTRCSCPAWSNWRCCPRW